MKTSSPPPIPKESVVEPAGTRARLRRFALNGLIAIVATTTSLALADLLLIALGLLPPKYEYGDAEVGWVAASATGALVTERCFDALTRRAGSFSRNEDGYRTRFSSAELRTGKDLFKVAVSGDSHTELCAPNADTHFGVTERELIVHGTPAAVFARGAGKYSALQAYLSVRTAMREYDADAFILDFYTGNDFYDMLRVDDRPSLVAGASGYAIAPPVWYQLDPPGSTRRSRVLFILRQVAQRIGVRGVWMRVNYLRGIAAEQGQSVGTVVGYMNDIRRSAAPEVGYPLAFSAQMLNQQLFFKRFPGSQAESLRRVRALLELVRREQPGRLLVLSPLPSYELVDTIPTNASLLTVLGRIGLTYRDGVAQEAGLTEELRRLAAETGWVFVDNLSPLRSYRGQAPLYNEYDYHITPAASEIIGRAQSEAILAVTRRPPTSKTHAESR